MVWKDNGIFGTFIDENNGNQEKMKMKGHKLHVRRKLKEYNGKSRKQRPLLKMAYEDQLVHFLGLVLELSRYTLSLYLSHYWKLIVCRELWNLSKKGKKVGKRRKHERRSRTQVATTRLLAGIYLRVYISLIYLACMVLHVVLCQLGVGFSRCDSVFILAFPFRDSHGVVEFPSFC